MEAFIEAVASAVGCSINHVLQVAEVHVCWCGKRLCNCEPPPSLKSRRCLANFLFSTTVSLCRSFMKVMAGNPSRVPADLGFLCSLSGSTLGTVGELWINTLSNEVTSKNEHT